MTIATTAGTEFDIDKICKLALIQATIVPIEQEPSQTRKAWARDLLQLTTFGLNAQGLFAKSITFENTVLTLNGSTNTLSSTTLDVFGIAMYADSTQPDPPTSEFPVTPMLRDEYIRLPNKAQSGRPLRYYVDRVLFPVQVKWWPVPSAAEAGGRVRFQAQRLRADSNKTGSSTPDFETYWNAYFVHELAHQMAIAIGAPMGRVKHLQGLALYCLGYCKGQAHQRPNDQIIIGHGHG